MDQSSDVSDLRAAIDRNDLATVHPNARATLRKQLRDMGDPEKEKPREFHNPTSIAYARKFVEQAWVSGATIAVVREFGGGE